MKFVELKRNLDRLNNVYLISGEDRYLCYSALSMIENAANINLPDMNKIVLNGLNNTVDDITACCNIYPFADKYRLVVVQDFNGKPNPSVAEKQLENYLASPMNTTILVFFNINEASFFKNLKTKLTFIDCSKLDSSNVHNFIVTYLDKNQTKYTNNAVNLLGLYCNYNMQKISSELEKLVCYCNKETLLTESVVKNLVVQDREYQIFELAEFIANNKAGQALDLIDSLGSKNSFGIISLLYSNYRRALYISISNLTDTELSKQLNIKEYAVKLMRNQVKVFSPKKLKKIVDKLMQADCGIKQGKIKEDVAVKTIILDILKIRNS